MARKVFYSFYFKEDNWRASQVRNMGVIEGNKPVSDNDWEQITRGGDAAIRRWINDQMNGTSCTIVLIGSNTAGRKWIKYEIEKSWKDGKGVMGIYIHSLKDKDGNQTLMGRNPFDDFVINGKPFSQIVRSYNPPYTDSKQVYDYIKSNLASWVEEAIRIRKNY
ncbi:MAG: TIR domain-containing protein [Ignavibacterium sp.]|nr:TIR domain-containing protein [Ignavibacterium sp.]